ncbi:hypothetical protein P879_00560 [Paragonimus westermani]|uniref:Uncharacterized protein n=1 Tax=Paragonimus westermani TaxID=34504 RepID=A0A8T0DQK4_9TREM|nr:hypothetical protein P879_00560 [Paragonimus westermani]
MLEPLRRQLLVQRNQPYYVLATSILLALYMIITALVVDNQYENTFTGTSATKQQRTTNVLNILSTLLMLASFILVILIIARLGPREILHTVIFALVGTAFISTISSSMIQNLQPDITLPAVPTANSTVLASLVAIIISLAILILPCIEQSSE